MMNVSTEVDELLSTYNFNCKNVETVALNTISSFEIPVFNGLRNVSAHHCYTALNNLEKWFGRQRTVEHCICLTVLTEYISCSFINTAFYETFKMTKSNKFLENLFLKLYKEWSMVLESQPPIEFPSKDQYESVLKSLQTSISRFPVNSPFKKILMQILSLSKNFPFKSISFKYNEERNSSQLKSLDHSFIIKPKSEHKIEDNCVIESRINLNFVKEKFSIARYLASTTNLKTSEFKQNNAVPKESLKSLENINELCHHEATKLTRILSNTIKPIAPPTNKIINAFDVLMKRTPMKRKAVW